MFLGHLEHRMAEEEAARNITLHTCTQPPGVQCLAARRRNKWTQDTFSLSLDHVAEEILGQLDIIGQAIIQQESSRDLSGS
jgi:hypothetical protein